jgi:hypothetical protein
LLRQADDSQYAVSGGDGFRFARGVNDV